MEFTRFFGGVQRRKRGGITDLTGEETYSSARHALRFVKLKEKRLGLNQPLLRSSCAFRRFFSDGDVVNRVEVGLILTSSKKSAHDSRIMDSQYQFALRQRHMLSLNQLFRIASDCFELPVQIRTLAGNHRVDCKLKDAGRYISALFLHASTHYTTVNLPLLNNWWITPGEPILLLEFGEHEAEFLPQYGIEYLKSLNRIELAHTRITIDKSSYFRVWFICKHRGYNKDTVRRLRISLLRLHAEHESLKQIFRAVSQRKLVIKRGTEASDQFQKYIDKAINDLSRQDRFGLPQQQIARLALEYNNIVTADERATLLCELEKIRRNIYKKVESFTLPRDEEVVPIVYLNKFHIVNSKLSFMRGERIMQGDINFGSDNSFSGPIIVADIVKDSLNTINSAKVSEDLQTTLKEITKLVAKLCDKLDPKQAENIASDLKSFTREAVSVAPRPNRLKTFADSILDAAKFSVSLADALAKAITAATAFMGLVKS